MRLAQALEAAEHAQRGRLRPVRARAFGLRALGGAPAVPAGVGVGVAVGKDEYGLALRVYEQTDSVAEFVEFAEKRYGGSDVYVELTRRGRPLTGPVALAPGVSIGAADTSGTLGGFVRCNTSRRVGVLSNNHVLAGCNTLEAGTPVLQPAPLVGGTPAQRIGVLDRFVPLEFTKPNTVDAAFGVLDEHVTIDAPTGVTVVQDLETLLPEPDTPEWQAQLVEKLGATSGLTQGRLTALNLAHEVEYPIGDEWQVLRFKNSLEVRSDTVFSQPGDSGSVVRMAGTGEVVGLLFAGIDDPVAVTFCHLIADVLGALDVHLVGSEGS